MCVLGLSACGVQAPLDDAYHWEDRTPSYSSASTSSANTTSTSSATSAQEKPAASESKPAQPTLEFTNVQDTTITVKIHR